MRLLAYFIFFFFSLISYTGQITARTQLIHEMGFDVLIVLIFRSIFSNKNNYRLINKASVVMKMVCSSVKKKLSSKAKLSV